MRFSTFGVHQISYEGLKKFNHGGAYFGRGLLVALMRSAIRALVDSASEMTPFQRDLKPALSIRAVSADSVHAPSTPGDDTAIRTFKCKIVKAATEIVAAFFVLATASYSERTAPLARTALRTERSRRDPNPDK